MPFERSILVDQEVQSLDSATRRIELPEDGFLSALLVEVSIQNGATAGDEFVVDAIDRVEVIADGSQVLFSLEGFELHRWNWFWTRREPSGVRNGAASTQRQSLNLIIPFGRYVGDPEYSLPLGAFRNVEVRIQYSPTISATAFTTATTRLHIAQVWAPADRSPAGRIGWLRTTQIDSFTSAASGERKTELPQSNPLWDLMIYAREAAIEDGVDITIVELQHDSGRIKPYKARWDELQAQNEYELGIDPTIQARPFLADNATFDTLTGRIRSASIEIIQNLAAAADFTLANVAAIAGDRITTHEFLVEGSATYAATALQTTRQDLLVTARGLGVGNAVLLPFATKMGSQYALDTPNLTRPELVLTQGGADATCRISARELIGA